MTSTMLPYSFAKKHQLFLETIGDNQVLSYVQMPSISILSEVQRQYGEFSLNEELSLIVKEKIQHSHESTSVTNLDDFHDHAHTEHSLNSIAMDLFEPTELLDSDDEAPIIRLLNAIFAQAVLEEASDIHIESYEGRVRIRYRVNGTLRQVLEPSLSVAPLLVSRIKVMAKLDISEKRLPQDGRIAIQLGGRLVDMRVSTMPSGTGEKVVLRLLDKQTERLMLQQLGMPDQTYQAVSSLIKNPHGIILVTGPTGSGKTTTLYAALAELNNDERNIMTVEDPVEYFIDGINQTQINTKADMTFAKGLRAILRQDPDVVMVGEIRDSETAKIAVQASLTGHLVFSTLHTNTTVGAITRLRDIGVEPFLLSSSVNGVLAQRLIRTLCPHCKQLHISTAEEKAILAMRETESIYQAHGCEHCNNTGFIGRKGLYELLIIDDQIKSLIHSEASELEIRDKAKQSSSSLKQQAMQLVVDGQTSLDEAVRITSL